MYYESWNVLLLWNVFVDSQVDSIYQAVKSGTFGRRFAVVTNITTEAVSNQNPRRNKTGGTLVANDGKPKEAMCFMYSKI